MSAALIVVDPDLRPPERIRVVLRPQDTYFTADAIATFLSAEWTISTDADRMGARLDGPAGADSALDLDALHRENLASGVVCPFE